MDCLDMRSIQCSADRFCPIRVALSADIYCTADRATDGSYNFRESHRGRQANAARITDLLLRSVLEKVDPAVANAVAELFLLAPKDLVGQVRVIRGIERLAHDVLLDPSLLLQVSSYQQSAVISSVSSVARQRKGEETISASTPHHIAIREKRLRAECRQLLPFKSRGWKGVFTMVVTREKGETNGGTISFIQNVVHWKQRE